MKQLLFVTALTTLCGFIVIADVTASNKLHPAALQQNNIVFYSPSFVLLELITPMLLPGVNFFHLHQKNYNL